MPCLVPGCSNIGRSSLFEFYTWPGNKANICPPLANISACAIYITLELRSLYTVLGVPLVSIVGSSSILALLSSQHTQRAFVYRFCECRVLFKELNNAVGQLGERERERENMVFFVNTVI